MSHGKEQEYLRHLEDDKSGRRRGEGTKDLANGVESVPRKRLLDGACTASKCTGTEACTNATGPIGTCACDGPRSCYDTKSTVRDGSCNGFYACNTTTSDAIGYSSCNGSQACESAKGSVGNSSCTGTVACHYAFGTIGSSACNGVGACSMVRGRVGDGSCNGFLACLPWPCDCSDLQCRLDYCGLPLSVGKNSCNGDKACSCPNPKGHAIVYQIGDGECNLQGGNFDGENTCCLEGKEYPCDCTEMPEGGLGVGDNNTCKSINRGFTGGTLKCNHKTCQFDTSECIVSVCGDGNVEGDEQCEGTDPPSETCAALGFAGGGNLKCNSSTCQFDTLECTTGPVVPVCGDGIVQDGGEECDGENLNSKTCASMGYSGGGTLKCSSDTCLFDFSQCIIGPQGQPAVCNGFFLWCWFAMLVEILTFGWIKLY